MINVSKDTDFTDNGEFKNNTFPLSFRRRIFVQRNYNIEKDVHNESNQRKTESPDHCRMAVPNWLYRLAGRLPYDWRKRETEKGGDG